MWNLIFGKKVEKTSTNDTINKLRDQIDIIEKREKHLYKRIEEEKLKAQNLYKNNNKNGAVLCLKNKKNLESQIDSLNGQKLNLETTIAKLEETTINIETLKIQDLAAKTINNIYKDTNMDKVDKVIDNINDSIIKANEIGQALSVPINNSIDDIDIEDELNELEKDMKKDMKKDDKLIVKKNKQKEIVEDKKEIMNNEEIDEYKKLEMELLA